MLQLFPFLNFIIDYVNQNDIPKYTKFMIPNSGVIWQFNLSHQQKSHEKFL